MANNEMTRPETVISIRDVKKQYKLGQIGGGTLTADLQSWWARIHGREDPNTIVGTDTRLWGTKFMALNGVSFDVHKGEAVGIIGRNGAGKSTLLKILSRITAPTEGDICIKGRVASMLEVGTGFNGEMTPPNWTRSLNSPSVPNLSSPRSSGIPAVCSSSWLSRWPPIWTAKSWLWTKSWPWAI